MLTRSWRASLRLLLFSTATSLALLTQIPVQALTTAGNENGIFTQISRLLEVLFYAMPENPALLTVLTAGVIWLYQRFLFAGRRSKGEYVLAGFLSAAMLFSRAIREAEAVSVLWSNTAQMVKAVFLWAGTVPLWLAVIQMIRSGLDWLGKQKTFAFRRPLLTPMLLMLAVWLPQALIVYPGSLAHDTVHQLHEFFGDSPFLNMNPPVHTVLLGAFIQLGDWLGCAHFGLFLVTVAQVVCMAWILAWFLNVLQRLKMPSPLILGLLAVYLFLPVYSAYATAILKDSACSIAAALLMIQTFLLVMKPEIFWEHKGRGLVLWSVAGWFTILMRKNGIGMALPTMLAAGCYTLYQAQTRKSIRAWLPLICSVVVIAASQATTSVILSHYSVGSGSLREVFSIPFQQTARVLIENDVPAEEVEIIDQVLDADVITEQYVPAISDQVKTTFREEAGWDELFAYANVWAKHLLRYPSSNADALFAMIHSIFSPSFAGDVFYGTDFANEINGGKWHIDEWQQALPLHVLRQPLQELQFCSLRLPFVSLLANLGANVILVIILGYFALRDRRLWIVWLPVLMCIVMLLFSPVTCTRYALPVFYGVPVLLTAACLSPGLKK